MWFYTALLTSVISAVSVIVNKKLITGVSAILLTWITLVFATPVVFVFALKDGWPATNLTFLLGVVGSVLFYTVSKVMALRAMRKENLPAIYPLISLGPIFTLIIAYLPPLSEQPGFLSVVGVLITLIGAYVLNVTKAKESILAPFQSLLRNKASLFMILSVLIDSVVIVFDKIAINNTIPKATTFTLLMENLLIIVGLLPVLYYRNPGFTHQITKHSKWFLLIGSLNAIITILGFSAVGGGSVGLVSAILKMQMLLVLLFSLLAFKDKPKFETLLGSLVMILGVVLIKLGS